MRQFKRWIAIVSHLRQSMAIRHLEGDVAAHRTRIADGGRVVIPADMRRELGLQSGSEVILDVTNGELRIRTLARVIERAQELVRRYVPDDARLADALIQDRRAATELE
jgi:AbrB family looped-hinge helix DNA binding protein